jgi:hypothetical protein
MHLKYVGAVFSVVMLLPTTGCSSKNVIFATNSSIGLDVSGIGTTLPNHASVAYDRQEIIYVPKGCPSEPSVLGTLDSELTWTKGVAVGETFATGDAALAASKKAKADTQNAERMLILTGTRTGFSLDFGQPDLNAPSFLFGYKRFNLAVVPPRPDSHEIQSVFADISIHGSGIRGSFAPSNPNFEGRTLSDEHGVRIVQTVATGKAAVTLVNKNREAVVEKLTPMAQMKEKTRQYKTITTFFESYDALSPEGKAEFVGKLNELTGCENANTDGGTIQTRLHGLSEDYLGRTLETVQRIYEEENR